MSANLHGRIRVSPLPLRPVERRVLSLLDDGVDVSEIAHRFRRSEDHITRIAGLARLPGRAPVADEDVLRPIERRILRWRSRGASHTEIGVRFRRSPASTEQIEALAHY